MVDVAVRMRRFPDGVLWSEVLAEGTLASCHIGPATASAVAAAGGTTARGPRAGMPRDLHLANVLQLAGEATAFDAIEFDAELRWIDVLDDIAFLTMAC